MKKHLSFEFFPPRTQQGVHNLTAARKQLAELKPDFFSVTYGAGGSTRDSTLNAVLAIHNDGQPCAAHISAPQNTFNQTDAKQSLIAQLQDYKNAGISRLVALRGDLSDGHNDNLGNGQAVRNNQQNRHFHANDLVKLITENFDDYFDISVAAYPEIHPDSMSYQSDIDFLKQKLDAGANRALTQYFYNADAYFYYLEDCQKAGIQQPIIPGIMPITNVDNLIRFSNNCGADIPRWLSNKLQQLKSNDKDLADFGNELIIQLCDRLLAGGAPGLHFYTMNKASQCLFICDHLEIQLRP